MQASLTALDGWLLRTTIAGGVVLLVGALWMLLSRQPIHRQRIGEIALFCALLVAIPAALPSWWSFSHSNASPSMEFTPFLAASPVREKPAVDPHPTQGSQDVVSDTEIDELLSLLESVQVETIPVEAANEVHFKRPDCQDGACSLESSVPALGAGWWRWVVRIIGAAYLFLVGALLVRCVCGYYGLWRYWRQRRPAPAHVIYALEELVPNDPERPRIGVCPWVHGPVSFGLWKPTILIPPTFCNEGDPEKLRWILAHELTHLRRRDAWGCLLLALGGAFYFHLPWFWWMKRQVRLAQEYVADAAAAKIASAVEYAEYLVSLTALTSRPTLASGRAVGVFESPSDLYRRVHMLLRQRNLLEGKCPRWWTLSAAASFFALAACTAGVQVAADEPDQKQDVQVVIIDDDDDDKSGDKKATDKKELRFKVEAKDDGKGAKVFQWKDGKFVEAKPGEYTLSPRILGDDDHGKRVEEALKKIDQVLAKLPKEAGSDTRKTLEDLKATLKKLKANKVAFGGNAVWEGKADEARKLGEKAKDEAVVVARAAREKALQAEKKVRSEVEARLKEARARAEERGDAKDDVVLKLEKAIAEKEKALKALKDSEVRAGAEREKADVVKKFMQNDLLAKSENRARVVEKMVSNKGRLGVSLTSVDDTFRSHLDLRENEGIMLQEVFDPSAAWNNGKGMRSGDILVEFGGKKISSDAEKFRNMIDGMKEGSYEAVVIRKGKRTTLQGIKLPGKEKKSDNIIWKGDGIAVIPEAGKDLQLKLAPVIGELKDLEKLQDGIKVQVEGLKDLHAEGIKALTLDGVKKLEGLDKDVIVKLQDASSKLKDIKGDVIVKLDDIKPEVEAKLKGLDVQLKGAAGALKDAQGELKLKLAEIKPELEKDLKALEWKVEGLDPKVALKFAGDAKKAAGVPLKLWVAESDDGQAKPRLGVMMEAIPESVASQLELDEDRGLMVKEVVPGSAAEKAGFLKNDIVIEFANKRVSRDAEEFSNLIKELKPGTYTATVMRKGKEVRIKNIALPDPAKVKEKEKSKIKDWTVDDDKKADRDDEMKKEAKEKAKDNPWARNPQFGNRFFNDGNKNTSVSINNNQFTAKQTDDDKTITVNGTMINGKPEPKKITVKSGDSTKTYTSMNDVPKETREQVQDMIKGLRGGVRGFQFGGVKNLDEQIKHMEAAMKEMQRQLGQDNPNFKQIEEEIKRMKEQMRKLDKEDEDK